MKIIKNLRFYIILFYSCICVIFISFFFSGCKSAPILLAEHSPAAIVSVLSNPTIPWIDEGDRDDEEDDGEGILSVAVNKFLGRNNPEILTAADRLLYAEESFHSLFSEIADTELLDKDVVLSSKTFKSLKAGIFSSFETEIAAEGYLKIYGLGAKNARILMEELNAKSLIFVTFKFNKKRSSANKWSGSVYAVAQMSVKVLDNRGKEIINKDYTVTSTQTTPLLNRKYDRDALVDMFPELIDYLITRFIVDYM